MHYHIACRFEVDRTIVIEADTVEAAIRIIRAGEFTSTDIEHESDDLGTDGCNVGIEEIWDEDNNDIPRSIWYGV